MDHEISEESIDGRDCGSCARPGPADRYGARNNDIIGESRLRPHSRLSRLPTPCRCEYDSPMAEGDFLEGTPSGVSSFEEKVLGATFVGERISGGNDGNDNGSNGRKVHFRTGRGASDR